MIDLYYAPTPNGHKITLFLEEAELDYRIIRVDISKGEQFSPLFLAISPNNKIPAIIDNQPADGGRPLSLFESGEILLYLAEKTGKLLPQDPKRRSQAIQWLMFQMGGVGPMMGQANVFFRYFPQKIQPAIDRYQAESRRLLGVLDRQLAGHEWLAGEYSIADIANFAWARTHRWSGVDVSDMPHLKRWRDAMHARPAVQRGLQQPPSTVELTRDGDARAAEFSERARTMVVTGGPQPGEGARGLGADR